MRKSIRMPTQTKYPRGGDNANSRLPREILDRVFVLGDIPTYPTEKGSRWSPMSVCRYWRDVALSNARLWTKIEATGWQLSDMTSSSLRLWMGRSRTALLDVNFDVLWADTSNKYPADHVESFFRVILAHTTRFEKLDIKGYPYQLTKVLHLLRRAKRLNTLSIESWHPAMIYGLPTPPNMYHSWSHTGKPRLELPALQCLTLNIGELDFLPHLDSGLLQSLHLDDMFLSFGELRQFFGNLPTVACLKMSRITHHGGLSDRDIAAAWSDRVKCEAFGHLRSITLDTDTCEEMYGADVLLVGAKESLVHLVIAFQETRYLPKAKGLLLAVKTLVLRCNRIVMDNEIEELLYDEQDVFTVLETFPNLCSLELSWDPFGEKMEVVFTPFLRALSNLNEDATTVQCCTSLCELRLRHVTTDVESLLEVSKARRAKESGEFRMTLQQCYGLPDVHDACYEELVFQLENMVEINLPFSPDDI